jgi:hypothetical protein
MSAQQKHWLPLQHAYLLALQPTEQLPFEQVLDPGPPAPQFEQPDCPSEASTLRTTPRARKAAIRPKEKIRYIRSPFNESSKRAPNIRVRQGKSDAQRRDEVRA